MRQLNFTVNGINPYFTSTLESWASIVVGTCMKSTPLNKDEARNPVKSPVAPATYRN